MWISIGLGIVETLLMGVILFEGGRRWRVLDRGARRVVSGIGVFFTFSVISLPLVLTGFRNAQLLEVPQLIGTLCLIAGFAAWQPRVTYGRIVIGLAVAYVILWVFAQWIQGIKGDFSVVSAPLNTLVVLATAGFTLVTRVQASSEQWTMELWFWFAIGSMIVFGSEIILEPLWANVFGVRNDLAELANWFRLLLGSTGYSLIIWGLRSLGPASRTAADREAAVVS